MIVRIMGDNQYRIEDGHQAEISKLDNDLYAAIKAEDSTRFTTLLAQLTAFVREKGSVVPDEELVPSDLMVPAADMTMAEARDTIENDDFAEDETDAATSGAGDQAGG